MRAIKDRRLATERVFFQDKLNYTLDFLVGFESEIIQPNVFSEQEIYAHFLQKRRRLESSFDRFPESEKYLFHQLFDLFEIKHGIGERNKILRDQLQVPHEGKSIGFAGPIGVAKTTIAAALTKDLDASAVTKESPEKNPFWGRSQNNPEYMLRSQMYYLLTNIFSDMRTRLNPGVSVSDTSTLNDVLFAQWYNQTKEKHLTDEEYAVYSKLVVLLKPIMPKPDLLVALIPDNIDDLKEGIRRRATSNTVRRGELIFAEAGNQDLSIQTEIVRRASTQIPDEWEVPVLQITVPPIRTFEDPTLPYDYIYQIRERLGRLGELLNPSPEDAASEILRILADSQERQVIIVHSKSMFSGKTTAMCLAADTLGKDRILAFQPRSAIRDTEKGFESQSSAIVSRDGLQIPSSIIEDNSLWSIVKKIREEGIDPTKTPYIFIDEVMLFIAEAKKPNETIKAVEELRKMGFHVIVDGIDYTFQEKPFTFMHALLAETDNNPDWHQIEMSTRCRYCEKRATVQRRWIVDGHGKRIASYYDPPILAGNSIYEPVCGTDHISCSDRPIDFVKQQLPVS